jgi:chloramphenicol-sensitive protein RarD
VIEALAPDHDHKTLGVFASLGAFAMWGVLVVYWKALQHVSAYEILAHRIVWSLLFTAILLTLCRGWSDVARVLKSPRDVGLLCLSSLLVGSNWLTYIWSVTHGRIVEASLGYYITPLVNVALGTIFLRERLRAVQVAAFLLAGAGVANLLIQQHTVPWIAILLSVTFGFYGLIRKIATLESLPGLVAETAVLTLPAGGFLLYLAANGSGAAGHCGMRTDALLIGAGLVTSTPLLLFAYGARRISMAAMGIIQYVSPTGALLLAVLVYGEPFDAARKTTFALIWVALAIYSIHAIITSRRSQAAEPVTTPDCDS